MSQAIYYLEPHDIDQNHINQNGTAQSANIPSQAVNIPVGDVLNKTTLLQSLANVCDFPSYFSANWDSAWDCLTDSAVTHLTLNLTAVKEINTEDFDVFKRIIEDAYRDFGKPQLWVIMPPADDV
ncbi:barstar family protein [Psychrobacter immobilis]|uniref:barstar family protein n=1 Tax=Psychrobacter immobilis TaxID=498 RepID=UPI00191809DE|nr:barstar family protein [Psychrobacter immobilis]